MLIASKLDNVIVNVVIVVMTCSQIQKQLVFRELEPVYAKVATNWQSEEHMRDSFVHIIRELQGSDSISQAPIEFNEPFHLNWVGLLMS
jgi:hypothetical protein